MTPSPAASPSPTGHVADRKGRLAAPAVLYAEQVYRDDDGETKEGAAIRAMVAIEAAVYDELALARAE